MTIQTFFKDLISLLSVYNNSPLITLSSDSLPLSQSYLIMQYQYFPPPNSPVHYNSVSIQLDSNTHKWQTVPGGKIENYGYICGMD